MVNLAASHSSRIRFLLIELGLIAVLLLSISTAVSLGPAPISLMDVWAIAASKVGMRPRGAWSFGSENIVWLIRFPRVLLAVVVGGGLGVVGATLQALVRNTIADSYVLGASSGAAAGAVLVLGYGASSLLGSFGISVAAFVGSTLAFALVFILANAGGRPTPMRLVLAGIGVGYFFTGVTSFVTLTSGNPQLANQVLAWTTGSLARASWADLALPSFALVVGTAYLLVQGRSLNALLIGDETATTLGVEVVAFRLRLFALVSLLTGILVAVSGSIGFVGLMVPHIGRFFVGSEHRRLLPVCFLFGSIFLIVADTVGRLAFVPADLPVGVVTSLVGGPAFLWILVRAGRKQRRTGDEG